MSRRIHQFPSNEMIDFFDVETAALKTSEDVFTTDNNKMLLENPQSHLTIFEILFTGRGNEQYGQRCIEWLKKTGNVNTYIEGAASRFPNIPKTHVERAVNSLSAVSQETEEEISNEHAEAIGQKLLELLDPEDSGVCEAVVKRKGKMRWDLKKLRSIQKRDGLPNKICCMANDILQSLNVTDVPTSADVTKNDMRNQQEVCFETVSKRWKKQLNALEKSVQKRKKTVIQIRSFFYKDKPKYRIMEENGTEVFLGLREDGTEVAIKRMSKSNYEKLKIEERNLRLPELDNPHVVRYIDAAVDKKFGYLFLQLCEYTLGTYINKHKKKVFLLKNLAKEFLKSLKVLHCHTPQILHQDLKPENVWIDVIGRVRLVLGKQDQEESYTSSSEIGVKCATHKLD